MSEEKANLGKVSILILLDYLFLSLLKTSGNDTVLVVSILILLDYLFLLARGSQERFEDKLSQSLFYWIIYSYFTGSRSSSRRNAGLNPYFIGLSILIHTTKSLVFRYIDSLNPYFIGLSILIIYRLFPRLFYSGLNPYFIGLSILIRIRRKRNCKRK